MATIILPADFTEANYADATSGELSLVAVPPLTYVPATHSLSVASAGAGTSGIVTTLDQTIAGVKTFTSPPVCAAAATSSGQLVNKGYVDELIAMGVHWLANVNKVFNFATGDPPGLADGKRYIAASTSGDFLIHHIYTYVLATDSYENTTPVEGNAVYVEDDDSATFANQCILFNRTSWVSLGSSINHQSLIGAGTLTHATIDSYLNQALLTTSSPTFTSAVLQSPSTADPDGYGRLSLWRYMTAGSTYEFIRVGKGTASYPYETNNGAYFGFSYGANSAATNYGRLGMAGAASDSLRFNTQRVTIPLSAADALTVTGGASIGGAISVGDRIKFPNTIQKKRLVLFDSVPASEYGYFGLGVLSNELRYQVGGTAARHTFYTGVSDSSDAELMRIEGALAASSGVTIRHTGASTSTTTGALTIPNGGLGVGGAIWVNDCLQFPNGAFPKQIVLYDNGNDFQFRGFGATSSQLKYQVNAPTAFHAWYAGTSGTTESELMRVRGDVTNTQYGVTIYHAAASTSASTGALAIPNGGLGVGGAIWAGGAITGGSTLSVPGDCGLTLLADATQGQAGTYCKFSTYYNPGVYFNRRYTDLNHLWELTQMPTNDIVLYNRTDGWYSWKVDSNGTFRPQRGLNCTGAAVFSDRVTAATMTCSTAPSAATDVVRLNELTSFAGVSGAFAIGGNASVGGILTVTNATLAYGAITCATNVAAQRFIIDSVPSDDRDAVRKQDLDAVEAAQTASYTSVTCTGPWTSPAYTSGYKIFNLLGTVTMTFLPNTGTSATTDATGRLVVPQQIPEAMRPSSNVTSILPGAIIVNGAKEDAYIIIYTTGDIRTGNTTYTTGLTISMPYSNSIMWTI